MLSRHGIYLTARTLSPGSRRAFTTTPAPCLPRSRPDSTPASAPKSDTKRPKTGTKTSEKTKAAKKETKPEEKAQPPKLLGLLEQQARLDKSLKRRTAYFKGDSARAEAKLLIQGTSEHHDLDSFLDFAERKALGRETAVFKGTLYEYTVMKGLKEFGFHLERSGKSNDKGIDLIGHWDLPGGPHQIKVLIQCKLSRGTPANIRELDGAHAGAPSEWKGDNVLKLLVSSIATTRGVLQAVQASSSAVGALHIEPDGLTRQFIWNHTAGKRGLAGIGVTGKYQQVATRNPNAAPTTTETLRTVALTWKGKPFSVNTHAS